MVYVICFLVAFLTMLYLIAYGKGVDINAMVLCMVCVVGNAGYYALYNAQNLSEAILANKITYAIGCFAPMIMFIMICNICRINMSKWIQICLYFVQFFIYYCVCLSDKNTLFYKTIEYGKDQFGAHLIKTYGPVHTLYLMTLGMYMLASMAVVGISIAKKNCRISTKKANFLLGLFLFAAVVYFVERLAGIKVEVVPVIFTIENLLIVGMIVNISHYSATGNPLVLEDENKKVAYLVFNQKLMFMSCNDFALKLFPELADWEIDKVIPGSGGRFNTFLRVPFMEYVNGKQTDGYKCVFELQDHYYSVEIRNLNHKSRWNDGYVIEVVEGGMML